MEQINFQNQFFPLRELEISNANAVLISTTALNSLLMTDSGAYVSTEAELIDECIYYYVESSQITLSKRKLLQLILAETNA